MARGWKWEKVLHGTPVVRLITRVPRVQKMIPSALLFLSGAAALGYQLVWSRVFSTGLGHEAPAMLAVICAFMAGMGGGAWLLDRRIAASARPLSWYAVLEIVIGVWAALSVALLPRANTLAVRLTGVDPAWSQQWLVAFAIPLFVLLPATFAMGATFPAMERFLALRRSDRRSVGAVYAMNTIGAVAGVLIVTNAIAPRLGFSKTILLLAGINILCGFVAFAFDRLVPPYRPDERRKREQDAAAAKESRADLSAQRLALTVFTTGFLAIGYEVAGTRVLSQVLENTIYTFAAVLALYLFGTSIGAAIYQRLRRRADARTTLANLLVATAISCCLGVIAMWRARDVFDFARRVGDSIGSVMLAECAVATTVFFLPTLCMGALFSHLVQLARTESGGVGRAIAANTFGSALAPAVFGILLLPMAGSKWSFALTAVMYLALVPQWSVKRGGIAIAGLAALLVPTTLHIVTVPVGGKVVAFREGVMAAVAVVEDADGGRTLRVNNRFQMGGTAAADAEYRGAHLPLLLHPAPRRALFLGLGTGITLGGAVLHDGLVIDGVELVPEVTALLPMFEPQNRSPRRKSNVRIYNADARRFVRAATNQYDVIVADLFHPARDGAGSLYTIEHFLSVRERLTPTGLFCQWLPLHQLDDRMFDIIVRTFRAAFPHTEGFLLRFNVDAPVLGLIGSSEPLQWNEQIMDPRRTGEALREELRRLAIADSFRLMGHWVELSHVGTMPGPINTDDDPLVTFGAPQFVYEKKATPYGRLIRLINQPKTTPWAGPILSVANSSLLQKFNDYIQARDVYLRGLAADYEGHRDQAIAAYIESARTSEDFTSGYAQCLSIASLLARSNPAESRRILKELIAAQPNRPVARQLLEKLSGP
jgi:spermidine synthase